jgi:hypothetical protein
MEFGLNGQNRAGKRPSNPIPFVVLGRSVDSGLSQSNTCLTRPPTADHRPLVDPVAVGGQRL